LRSRPLSSETGSDAPMNQRVPAGNTDAQKAAARSSASTAVQ
jgi:hypothetical protein